MLPNEFGKCVEVFVMLSTVNRKRSSFCGNRNRICPDAWPRRGLSWLWPTVVRDYWPPCPWCIQISPYNAAGPIRAEMSSTTWEKPIERQLRAIYMQSSMPRGSVRPRWPWVPSVPDGDTSTPRQWPAWSVMKRNCWHFSRSSTPPGGPRYEPPMPLSADFERWEDALGPWEFSLIEPVWREFFMQCFPTRTSGRVWLPLF